MLQLLLEGGKQQGRSVVAAVAEWAGMLWPEGMPLHNPLVQLANLLRFAEVRREAPLGCWGSAGAVSGLDISCRALCSSAMCRMRTHGMPAGSTHPLFM